MRLGVWNCCNGLSHPDQVTQFRRLNLDIAIIPECRERDIPGLCAESAVWRTNNYTQARPKGLTVLSFNGFELDELDYDAEMEIYIPLRITRDNFSFELLAVWNFYHAAKQGRFQGAKGADAVELAAIERYAPLMRDHFVMAGDFNYGPTYSGAAFVDLCNRLKENGILSTYHEWENLPVDRTEHATFRHSSGNKHHLDHIFSSKDLTHDLADFEIIPFDQVLRSDHAPMIAQFAIA